LKKQQPKKNQEHSPSADWVVQGNCSWNHDSDYS
jgi:hypothetical protein